MKHQVDLSQMNTFQIASKADVFTEVVTLSDLEAVSAYVKDNPSFFYFGRRSKCIICE